MDYQEVTARWSEYRIDSYVYAVEEADGELVKIGFAKNPTKRLSSLQTGNGRKLVITGLAPGGRRLEKALHRKLGEVCRLVGEWFVRTQAEEAIAYLNALETWLWEQAKQEGRLRDFSEYPDDWLEPTLPAKLRKPTEEPPTVNLSVSELLGVPVHVLRQQDRDEQIRKRTEQRKAEIAAQFSV